MTLCLRACPAQKREGERAVSVSAAITDRDNFTSPRIPYRPLRPYRHHHPPHPHFSFHPPPLRRSRLSWPHPPFSFPLSRTHSEPSISAGRRQPPPCRP